MAPARARAQTSRIRRVSLAPDLRDLLVCPKCKGSLEHRTTPDESLVCHACRLVYAVEDDIPIMLIDEAKHF